MKKRIFLSLLFFLLVLSILYKFSGNIPPPFDFLNSNSSIPSNNIVDISTNAVKEITVEEKKIEQKSKEIIKEFTEGDLVFFPKLKATDPEGNKVNYLFSKPLDRLGKWQTKEGDAGEYYLNITATDGELNATEQIKIRINKLNHPPILDILKTYILAKEGETINIDAKVSDPDNDSVSLTFSGFSTTASKQLSYEDAGRYEVVLIADDGKLKTTKKITIEVANVNRPPVFEQLKEIIVREGEKVVVKPSVKDPDGNEVKLKFEKPLNSSGEWQTKEGDAGRYSTNITASDGNLTATLRVDIIVETQNRAPIITLKEKTIKVKEGETVVLDFNVTDAEGDKTETEISGWMTSKTKQTDFNSQGKHEVIITAKDPTHTVTETIIVEVEDVNRPPVFDDGSFS